MAGSKGIALLVEGVAYDQWQSADVSRDLKDFSGSFSFSFRDRYRSAKALEYASRGAPYKLRPGLAVEIRINGKPVLKGWIDEASPDIGARAASVTISGRDKTGDLIDCAAMTDGPAEFKSVKLEEAARRIAAPYGLTVRSEIDTGEPFERYSLDLAETAFSAIEKGARSRHALILSDGVGGIVITRTGKTRAPADLRLPGNVLSSSANFSHKNRHSETIVRGQGEKAGKKRGPANLDATAEPLAPEERAAGDGSATDRERKGTAATGRAKDSEIMRHRPVVHLARSKADNVSASDEADWRMRTARAESEEVTHTVKGFDVDGKLWQVNQMVAVSDAYLDIERDMLISKVAYREDDSGRVTEISIISPEAFDKGPTGNRRRNKTGKKSAKGSGALDGTAEAL